MQGMYNGIFFLSIMIIFLKGITSDHEFMIDNHSNRLFQRALLVRLVPSSTDQAYVAHSTMGLRMDLSFNSNRFYMNK